MNKTFFKKTSNLMLSVFISLLVFGTLFTQVYAQEGAGIGITPAVIDPAEKFKPGQVAQFLVKISNLSESDQTYFLSTRDIVGVKDGGVPIFADPNAPVTDFELSSWITLKENQIFIPKGGQVDVPIDVVVPGTVSPGSHFGSVVVSVDAPTLRSSGAAVGYEVANIISLRIEGEVEESARIRQFSTSQYIYGSTNVTFSARIENEGNTLVKPTGPLEVKNMFGKRVAQLKFNDSLAGIFPKTPQSSGLRDFEVVWTEEAPGFGRYEALLSVVYGTEGSMKTMSSTVTFWILPMNVVLPALVTLAVLFLVIFVGVKIYVRRSLSMLDTGNTRRLVRSRKQGQFPTLLVIVSMLSLMALFFIVLLLVFA
jgi:hypothetical protein